MMADEKPKKERKRDPALDQLLFPELWKEWTVRDLRRLADGLRVESVLRPVIEALVGKQTVNVPLTRKQAEALLRVFDVATWARKRIERLQGAANWNYMKSKFRASQP